MCVELNSGTLKGPTGQSVFPTGANVKQDYSLWTNNTPLGAGNCNPNIWGDDFPGNADRVGHANCKSRLSITFIVAWFDTAYSSIYVLYNFFLWTFPHFFNANFKEVVGHFFSILIFFF